MRIAFVSCMDEEKHSRQKVWESVQAQAPDVLLLLGDHIYMDWGLDAFNEESAWRLAIARDPLGQLARFASDMHARYARQWEVGRFRTLVRDVLARGGPNALLLTWDDHDFAWNNAYGGGDGTHQRHVAPVVASISRALFNQFAAVLRDPGAPDAYPAPPVFDFNALANGPPPALPEAVSAWLPSLTTVGDTPLLLLDQRSHRTHLDEPQPTLLGTKQARLLLDTVLGGEGLLIVAGSSPMRHDKGRHEQGWRSVPDPARGGERREYTEYRAFLDAAREAGRAVLYLAGDIHRNAYGGPVERDAQVVQVLSSGAARKLGGVGLFGLVTLPDAPGVLMNGDVHIELFRQTGRALETELTRTLTVRDGRWLAAPPGACTGSAGEGADNSDEDARVDGHDSGHGSGRDSGHDTGLSAGEIADQGTHQIAGQSAAPHTARN